MTTRIRYLKDRDGVLYTKDRYRVRDKGYECYIDVEDMSYGIVEIVGNSGHEIVHGNCKTLQSLKIQIRKELTLLGVKFKTGTAMSKKQRQELDEQT